MIDEQTLPIATPAAEESAVSEDAPTEATESTETAGPKRKGGKKKKFITAGNAHIQATYNNTIVTITDVQGNVLAWSSAGKVGFSGPKKATPYAASVIVRDVMEKVKPIGLKQLDVFVKGVGMGREAAVRALVANGMNLNVIKDMTPIPHNGPRARKVRRV